MRSFPHIITAIIKSPHLCKFTEHGISLNYQNSNLKVEGILHFQPLSPIRYDIMGPFALIPFMQCRHSVYSMTHKINGQLMVNNRKYVFYNDIGYIEGDRGYSFPINRINYANLSATKPALSSNLPPMMPLPNIDLFSLHI